MLQPKPQLNRSGYRPAGVVSAMEPWRGATIGRTSKQARGEHNLVHGDTLPSEGAAAASLAIRAAGRGAKRPLQGGFQERFLVVATTWIW